VNRTNPRLEERRAAHTRYKKDVEKRGKPFYPYAMFHDTVMSLVVVCTIVVLAVIWKFTAGEEPGEEGSGWLGPLYNAEADPGTTSFIPRPDWYFYFLFYLLRIFKWPDSVILATVGIPTIIMMLMIVLPFVDVRRERRLSRRPVAVVITILTVISMGILTYKGATARESLGSEAVVAVPGWIEKNNLIENAKQVKGVPPAQAEQLVRRGGEIFAQVGCLGCHTYLNVGSTNLGAPDLTDEGTKGKGIQFQIDHLKCPSCVTPGSAMPPFPDLGDENLRRLAVFLEASRG
jgi:menaquinol-cytochrome c reductase cytochrome b/c subunit